MSALSITPSSHPLACAAVDTAEAGGYLVAAHRRDGHIAVRITDTTDWATATFQILGSDKDLAAAIRVYTDKGWYRGVAS